ncbi:MAG: phosphoglycerate kinase [Chloroflexi bacterium]|nr:phosphoglycerate kinase [Chloroflexota bacterium]
MSSQFPRTFVGNISLPRLIIGCNWMSGFSHLSAAGDTMIRQTHNAPGSVSSIFETFLEQDIDAVLGLFGVDENLLPAVELAQERTGKKLIIIDEPIINVDDSPVARLEAKKKIDECAKRGATFCLPLHSCIEQLVNKNTMTINRLPDYLYMIREAGMIPGLSAHMPEVIQYADLNEYDVETYIQIYNCMGFLMQVEIESVAKIIQNAKKPVITIKPLAAGRTSPFVGLNFVFNTIREQDMVAIGCFDSNEAAEDIEFTRAAIERRPPNITNRNSPLETSVIKGAI